MLGKTARDNYRERRNIQKRGKRMRGRLNEKEIMRNQEKRNDQMKSAWVRSVVCGVWCVITP